MRRWITFILLAGIVLAVAGAACSSKNSGGTKAAIATSTVAAARSATQVLRFQGYEVTREGLAAYIHDSLFAGEDSDQVRIFCDLVAQPNYEPRQSEVPVMLWELEEGEAPGTLEKYGVRLVPGQEADPAHANVPHELVLDECARAGG